MAEETKAERIRRILIGLGAGTGADTMKSVERSLDELATLSDQDLVLALTAVRGRGQASDSQLAGIREGIIAMIDLRVSQRQSEQAEALRSTVDQLRKTEGAIAKFGDNLAKWAPLLARVLGGEGS